jgi:hypothetical protein
MRRSRASELLAPGAVLVVGLPSPVVTSVQARITSWQVVQLDERGAYAPVSAPLKNRRQAEAFAQQTFPFISCWLRVNSGAFIGVSLDSKTRLQTTGL